MTFLGKVKELGMSLTEVMVGGAIMTGVGLGAMTMFKNQNQAQKMIEHEADLLAYHQTLVKVFGNVSNCNATLKPFETKPYVGEPNVDGIAITNIRLCDTTIAGNCDVKKEAADTTLTPGGYFIPGGIFAAEGAFIDGYINGVPDLSNSKQVWRITDINVPQVNSSTHMRMKITYQMNQNIPNVKTLTKDILFNVRFDDAGTFRECVSPDGSTVDNLQREMCRGMSGVTPTGSTVLFFDEADQTCKPRSYCLNKGEEIAGVDSNGNIVCRKIINPTFVPNVNPSPVTCGGATPKTRLHYDTATQQLRVVCEPN